jgi:hypothetical protein
MQPQKAVRLQLGALLAADPTTLGPVLANKVSLVTTPFSDGENFAIGDLTYAAAHGLDPILCATGASEVAVDPVSQQQIITLKPGAGSGFRWVTTGGLVGPVNIYGFALMDNAAAVLLGVQALANPIILNGDGYQIDADPLQMIFVLLPLS